MTEGPRIDLFSDTQTRPSRPMREAMASAEVGDEQLGEDPSVRTLCAMVADLLGKEDALFLPSGTMCNEVAYRAHTQPGDEIILHETSHAVHYEVGGPAALSGVALRTLPGERGIFTAAQVRSAVRDGAPHAQRSRLVSVENTTNIGGGAVWPIDTLDAVADVAREQGLATHMDGARLMNAVVASGQPAAAFAHGYDSAWIDLSKGLGAPVGGVLAGSRGFIAEALRFKHQFGGAMRQAGIIAAAGIYALQHNVSRLAEDHANAQRFARLIAPINGIELATDAIETNMIYFDVSATGLTAPQVAERLVEQGVRIGAVSERRMRAVTHLDVDAAGVEAAAQALAAVAGA
ncbi:MAG: aminotransferase class I/II-fold pyridoxal phosphate-dependent enzyme [Gammaproteobacteria bacterium]|nr:aminotransferase class I/II-fold pyridoxal phosphate-dependent enzyme [Gammaproteobacteria bacterium]